MVRGEVRPKKRDASETGQGKGKDGSEIMK